MKLIARFNRINLTATVVILLLSGIAFYFLSNYLIIEQFDQAIQTQRIKVEKFVRVRHQIPDIIPVKDLIITFEKDTGYRPSEFKTELTDDPLGQDTADFRKLYFSLQLDKQWYRALVARSMESTENLHQKILAITAAGIVLILIASTIINRLVLKNLWQSFYKGLQLMKDYQVGQRKPVDFPDSDIEEFAFMNNVLKAATEQVDRDYQTLKEFSENASHEMQTPLAVLRSKLDLVLQDETVSANHANSLKAMYKAIHKLKNLNRSLLLLTKIGNNQFSDKSNIQLDQLVEEKLEQFQEMAQNKGLNMAIDVNRCQVNMNRELVDNLLDNLLSNAIKHNTEGGSIDIQLSPAMELIIRNTGKNGALDKAKLFTRFYKSEANNEFTGLGLSIMKQICVMSDCRIDYAYDKGEHVFKVGWQN